MYIYECKLTLLESTFFSSREINNYYQTEPMIGNYALCYALGFVNSPYHNKGEIHYHKHLSEMNEKKIYITPAKFITKVNFTLTYFNSLSDSYWSRMDRNAISTNRHKKTEAVNYPQIGWIKMLSIGNVARFYIFSDQEIRIRNYIRLGKFMSKAHVETIKSEFQLISSNDFVSAQLLNPLDIPKSHKLKSFDIYSVNPAVLIDNVTLEGESYKINNISLPTNMKFNVSALK